MGKGDKKSRRGKIIIGSTGVRRPKPSKRKVFVKVEAAVAEEVKKVVKVTEKTKAEPKPRAKAVEIVEVAAIVETEAAVAPVKAVKKAVKKTKSEDVTE